jgi:hypothetical protein
MQQLLVTDVVIPDGQQHRVESMATSKHGQIGSGAQHRKAKHPLPCLGGIIIDEADNLVVSRRQHSIEQDPPVAART